MQWVCFLSRWFAGSCEVCSHASERIIYSWGGRKERKQGAGDRNEEELPLVEAC